MTPEKAADRRKEIKRRLREIAAEPGQPGAKAEAQRLTGEYRRLAAVGRAPAASRPEPAADPEAAALATWPPELRARLDRSAMSRAVDRSILHDPDGWGALNDRRRRGARP